jgi:nitrite reductase/ring-hydroxylating ferredoxin subunit
MLSQGRDRHEHANYTQCAGGGVITGSSTAEHLILVTHSLLNSSFKRYTKQIESRSRSMGAEAEMKNPTGSGSMRREVYESVAMELYNHVKNRTTDSMADVKAVPVADYREHARWEAERQKIFKEAPVLAGLSCELKNESDYKALDIVGIPVLLTRGRDGVARAFLNVCRHRGAHIAEPGCGNRSRFVCPYHSWTYDKKGSLVGILDEAKFGHVDASRRQLVELYTREVAGLIFVCLTPGRRFDIKAFLGEMLDELASYRLETWTLLGQNVIEGPNWKVAMDGYIEFYHIASLHSDTLAAMVTNNVMACETFGPYPFGPHQRIAAPSNDIAQRLNKPVTEWVTGEAMLDVKLVFPNNSFAITSGNALSPAGGMVSQVFPGPSPEKSITIQNHIYKQEPKQGAEREALAEAIERFKYVVEEEDYKGGRQIQLGMNTDANATFIFGKNEVGPQNFHTALDHFLGEEDEDRLF